MAGHTNERTLVTHLHYRQLRPRVFALPAVHFYTRSLGLDFAVGKTSGCCVVCAVAEEHRSRDAAPDGARISTIPHATHAIRC